MSSNDSCRNPSASSRQWRPTGAHETAAAAAVAAAATAVGCLMSTRFLLLCAVPSASAFSDLLASSRCCLLVVRTVSSDYSSRLAAVPAETADSTLAFTCTGTSGKLRPNSSNIYGDSSRRSSGVNTAAATRQHESREAWCCSCRRCCCYTVRRCGSSCRWRKERECRPLKSVAPRCSETFSCSEGSNHSTSGSNCGSSSVRNINNEGQQQHTLAASATAAAVLQQPLCCVLVLI